MYPGGTLRRLTRLRLLYKDDGRCLALRGGAVPWAAVWASGIFHLSLTNGPDPPRSDQNKWAAAAAGGAAGTGFQLPERLSGCGLSAGAGPTACGRRRSLKRRPPFTYSSNNVFSVDCLGSNFNSGDYGARLGTAFVLLTVMEFYLTVMETYPGPKFDNNR